MDFVLDSARIVADGIKSYASPDLQQEIDRVMATIEAQNGKRIRAAIASILEIGLLEVREAEDV